MKVKSFIAALILSLTGIAVVANPAQAWPSDCPTSGGWTCVWDGQAYSGSYKLINNIQHTPDKCYNFSTSWNNQVESMANNSSIWLLRVFANTGCSGNYAQVAPGQWLASLGALNNNASSFILYWY